MLMIQLTIRLRLNNMKNSWNTKEFYTSIKREVKSKHKIKINGLEIAKVWKDYVELHICENLKKGNKVELKKTACLWVKATPLLEHKTAFHMFSKGLMYSQKRIKEAKIKLDSSKYIYKIVLDKLGNKETEYKMYFKPHKLLRNAVSEGIEKGKLITRFQCQ